MKKALALVLALVLALSMAVSAFAFVKPVFLEPDEEDEAGRKEIEVIDVVEDLLLYTYEGGTYYIALPDEAWEDIKLTTNGNVSAELVEFDPEKMVIVNEAGEDIVKWCVTRKGEKLETSGLTYDVAKEYAKKFNKEGHPDFDDKNGKVTYYGVAPITNVNVIKIVVEDNYTAHYTEGTIKVNATLDDEPYKGVVTVINDVVLFEYEEVKWTAKNFKNKAALEVDQAGYSDYDFDETYGPEYDEDNLRIDDGAAVVSTTAFRAIEGMNLKVVANDAMTVVLSEVAAGQKGVNFSAYLDYDFVDEDDDYVWDVYYEDLVAIELGFYGDQVVKGEYEIKVELPYDYYDLREYFGLRVEEDDIINYYVVDANNNVVKTIKVDYMSAKLNENVAFTLEGSNKALGQYKIVLDVPTGEVEGEQNPNTGAESVVGVVAALAVVSLATAAAVSLKK